MALTLRRAVERHSNRPDCLHLIVRTSWDSLAAHFGGTKSVCEESTVKPKQSKPIVESAQKKEPNEEKGTKSHENRKTGAHIGEYRENVGLQKSFKLKQKSKKEEEKVIEDGLAKHRVKNEDEQRRHKLQSRDEEHNLKQKSTKLKNGDGPRKDKLRKEEESSKIKVNEDGLTKRRVKNEDDKVKNKDEPSRQKLNNWDGEHDLKQNVGLQESSKLRNGDEPCKDKLRKEEQHRKHKVNEDGLTNRRSKNEDDKVRGDEPIKHKLKNQDEEHDLKQLQRDAIKAEEKVARAKLEKLDEIQKASKREKAGEDRRRRWHRSSEEFKLEEDSKVGLETRAWTDDRRAQQCRQGIGFEQSKEKEEEFWAVKDLKKRHEDFYHQAACIDTVHLGDLLRTCARTRNLAEGRRLHEHLSEGYYDRHTYLGNLLVQMYGNCGRLEEAREVFENLDEKNVFSWNIMQAAYVQNGRLEEARRVFTENPDKSVVSWNGMIAAYAQRGFLFEARELFDGMPVKNVVSWTGMLQAYAKAGLVSDARNLFDQITDRDPFTWNTMLSAYTSKGMLTEAEKLFQEMPVRDRVAWTAMISAKTQCGQAKSALQYYYRMVLEGIHPNKVTCLTVFHACAELRNFKISRDLHERFVENGLEIDVPIGTALVNMYAKCKNLHWARTVFDRMPDRDVVTWTAMVAGYADEGGISTAKGLYDAMPVKNVVSNNTMLGALIESGRLDEARNLFYGMTERNSITWSWIISGFAHAGYGREALGLFVNMVLEGVHVDRSTLASALTACSSIPAPVQGKFIHDEVVLDGVPYEDSVLMTSLLAMQASCGRIQEARRLFDVMLDKDMIAWTAMISGYLHSGFDEECIELFRKMLLDGMDPGSVTFIGLFSACSHVGLVEECRAYFFSMMEDYKVEPELDHYLCMVDLLGRAGQLDRAEELAETMPFLPVAGAWRAILSACRMHNDKSRADRAARRVSELDPKNGAHYVMLSNLHAEDRTTNAGRMEPSDLCIELTVQGSIQSKECVENSGGKQGEQDAPASTVSGRVKGFEAKHKLDRREERRKAATIGSYLKQKHVRREVGEEYWPELENENNMQRRDSERQAAEIPSKSKSKTREDYQKEEGDKYTYEWEQNFEDEDYASVKDGTKKRFYSLRDEYEDYGEKKYDVFQQNTYSHRYQSLGDYTMSTEYKECPRKDAYRRSFEHMEWPTQDASDSSTYRKHAEYFYKPEGKSQVDNDNGYKW